MVYDTTVPPPNPLTFPPSQSVFSSQVERSVVVACLTVSLCLVCCQAHVLIRISNIVVQQLCVWDWLIMLADEVAMVCDGERRSRRYILDVVYVAVR
jgi:hypothetical protein